MKVRGFIGLLVLAAIVLAPATGRAAGITVFHDKNFQGKNANFTADVPDLKALGMNGKISSLKVEAGERWQVCDEPHFQGECTVLTGEASDLKRTSWDNRIASFRRVEADASAGTTVPAENVWIILYDKPDFLGNSLNYTTASANLGKHINKAQSVKVGKGTWELCDEKDFKGRCVTLTGDVADLEKHGLKKKVSSVRPLTAAGDWFVVVHEEADFGGTSTRYERSEATVDKTVKSVTVGKGTWELCDGKDFTGKCVVLDVNAPDFSVLKIGDRIRSLRPVQR